MAQLVPITVLVHERDNVSAGGLPKEATVSVTGQDFVIDGQRIAPVDKGSRNRP